MGFLGDFIDDVFDLPEKVLKGTAKTIAFTLSLPLHMVQAAIDAGCKTEQEIQDFCDRRM